MLHSRDCAKLGSPEDWDIVCSLNTSVSQPTKIELTSVTRKPWELREPGAVDLTSYLTSFSSGRVHTARVTD